MFAKLLLSVYVILLSMVWSDHTADHACEPEETAFADYWTTSNQFRPDGCIDRAAVTLVQIDHGSDDDFFWKLPRAAASRACQTFGGMNCLVQNPVQFNNRLMAELIVEAVYVDNIFGLAVTLPGTEIYDYIASVAQQGIHVSALNSGIDDWQSTGAKMFVGQSDYVAGYDACLHLQGKYGCTKFLMLDHQGGNHNGVLDRGFGCNDAMNRNNTRIFVSNGAATTEVPTVVDALNADAALDCVMALGANPETYVNILLTDPDPATNWGIDPARLTADRVKAMAAFDYNGDIFARIESGESITKFAIDQQPYLQGFIPMMLMGLKASTGAHVLEPSAFNSGPAFIETAEQVGLLSCMTETVYYCHDDEEHLSGLAAGCSCIDTMAKTVYLFHHGGDADDGTALSNFYAILSNAVSVAAADFNVTLKVHTYSHQGNALDLAAYKAHIESVLAADVSQIAGIITTVPNRAIGELLLHNADLEHLEIVGIADGYALYEDLTDDPAHLSERQSMYVGQNEPQAGAAMAALVYEHGLDVNGWAAENTTAPYNGVLLCLDDEKGELASLVERCEGAAAFAAENDVTLLMVDVADKQNSATTLNGIRSAVGDRNVSGIIATGEASCVAAVSYIAEVEEAYDVQVALGCFDASNAVLDLLLDDSTEVDFIFDQQPYLVGYAATMMLANKLLLGMIPAQLLIETGPKLITLADEKVVKTKQCESAFLGYDFCPSEALTVSTFEINHPTAGNFGGVVMILLFALTVVISLIVWVVMYVWRSEPMFKGLQWEFMSMTMVGGILMMLSGLFVMGGDELSAFQCNGPYAVWSVGFSIFFVSYALRVWKVVVLIENGLLFKRRPITQKHLFMRLAVFVLIDVLLVIIAATATPFEVNTEITVEEEVSADGEVSSFREVTTTFCTFSDAYSAMWIIVFIYKFVILLWVISIAMRKQILADKVKKLKFMKFEEGSNIAIGIYMVVISFLVFGLIAFVLGTSSTLFSSTLQWTIISFLSFICYVTIICCVVLHRVVYVLNKSKANKTADMVGSAGSKDSGATSQQSSTNPDIPTEASVDETALDPLLQRAEFLANELLEVISNPQFSQSAAMSMSDVMRQLQEKLNRKEMSRTEKTTEVELA